VLQPAGTVRNELEALMRLSALTETSAPPHGRARERDGRERERGRDGRERERWRERERSGW